MPEQIGTIDLFSLNCEESNVWPIEILTKWKLLENREQKLLAGPTLICSDMGAKKNSFSRPLHIYRRRSRKIIRLIASIRLSVCVHSPV